jgi:hypothetical protein
MTINEFRNVLNAAPLRPFKIRRADGQIIPVQR